MLALVGWKIGVNEYKAVYLRKSMEPCKAQTLDFIMWLSKPTEDQEATLMQMIPKDKAKFPWVVKGY